jgi:hypothetical protein
MSSGKFQTPEEIRKLFEKRVYRDYVRTESLNEDLFAFLSSHADRLQFQDRLTVPGELTVGVRRRNTSVKVPGLTPDVVSPELRALVRQRDWLIYEMFGYDAHPKGRPPNCMVNANTSDDVAAPSFRDARREKRRSRRARNQAD